MFCERCEFERKFPYCSHELQKTTQLPKYQFFYVNSTLELLDSLATNLEDLDTLNLFPNQNYPWSVNLYDLDIITDSVKSPVYFLHYVHQRLNSHKKGIVKSVAEGEFLGCYFKKWESLRSSTFF